MNDRIVAHSCCLSSRTLLEIFAVLKVVARLLVRHMVMMLMISNYERRDLRDWVLAVGSDRFGRSMEVLDTSLIDMLRLCCSTSILRCQFWLSLLDWLMYDIAWHIRRRNLRLHGLVFILVVCEASGSLLSILLI